MKLVLYLMRVSFVLNLVCWHTLRDLDAQYVGTHETQWYFWTVTKGLVLSICECIFEIRLQLYMDQLYIHHRRICEPFEVWIWDTNLAKPYLNSAYNRYLSTILPFISFVDPMLGNLLRFAEQPLVQDFMFRLLERGIRPFIKLPFTINCLPNRCTRDKPTNLVSSASSSGNTWRPCKSFMNQDFTVVSQAIRAN